MVADVTLESAMKRLKQHVYKQRVRVKDFIMDFDKLNSGYVFPNHFLSALSMAGIDKYLSPKELEVICETYKVQRDATLVMVDHRTFLHELELVFTVPHLEKDPLVEVATEPADLLDKTRYLKSSRVLQPPEREEAVQAVICRLSDVCYKRGQPVKAFFDDAARDDHSAKLFGHVTLPQFRQVLTTKLDWVVSDPEVSLLAAKFLHEDKPEFINYIAFSCTVDPPERYYEQ
ncbi:hypothetical protein CHLRE_02g142126v5 [Chlamydomonas reinhardtii]|jgi:hypothetical protein|uniref:Uncharacterized protein n=1 Tax=Chlamydomonas reinhardtii TaxID=3055 RepID=A8JDK1_CHLRE|nr:uncharacterized protein CHLRE_02g142126v5 [Chlamydomonas reinhardtii]6U42_5X Chain 5X, FAP115 [Chlamydomonas reinhardtii]6U42_5Y Chain 5Y, FAP115 [Chlamydomonas reinhardtii]6U42_5Z Chain 5Z, FAP115 [Chlamydomonas reinhardtii]6U42_6A Chain 6A, FAP115 [Chlamydomonas reinhardtii]6U42_6B Chain 6B, FAP115 [Chlamydomonas reinhardtii]6U42_6C Chain 6C, FAP115 [Chlamydomonas reinhardtii]6U42_6D Chain 6D, FAP115 [Chlamydomonas reinhardtii]8GLV_5X Chain 5X, Flagellar associated protein [Chlamydomon|eukprot:XP_001700506.1 flagellar associated protein [Chlamydomonas reinhardtii]